MYEYGKGGRSCFHSCLHPAGVERKPVESHPEVLEVEAKPQQYAMADAKFTLGVLPEPGSEFERSEPPRKVSERQPIVCFECGEEGHIARECPERMEFEDQEDWEGVAQDLGRLVDQPCTTEVTDGEPNKKYDRMRIFH